MVHIRDVARQAGVSVATVSRVINGSPLVADASRQKILRVMEELDYAPSVLARNLRGGRTKLFGVLVPDNFNPFWSSLVRSVEDAAYTAGYSVIVCSSDGDTTRALHYLRLLHQQRVAGIIGAVPAGQAMATLQRATIPFVSVDTRLPGIDSVLLDNAAAAALAVDHLIQLGHRRIGLITGPLWTTSGRGRLIGYRRAMRRAGLPLTRAWQAIGPYSAQAGATAAREMVAQADRPSALIAASNDIALGAYRAVMSMRLQIPDDLALVAFDELSWDPALAPPVTTIVQPSRAIGREACNLLLERLAGGRTGSPRRLYLPGYLVARHSTTGTDRTDRFVPETAYGRSDLAVSPVRG